MEIPAAIDTFSAVPWIRVVAILLASLLIAFVARVVIFRLVLALSGRTKTQLDDRLAAAIRMPVLVTILLCGASLAAGTVGLGPPAVFILRGAFQTIGVLIWGRALVQMGAIVLDALSDRNQGSAWIQPRTLPMFTMVFKVLLIGGMIYLILVTWHINVTSWLASAGVLGLAVGFAAKDTLANLFAGVFILADAPYKIGDFVVLDSGLRGMVTDIGVRSSRLLTRDDIEVTVPNAVIASGKIVNETGGPHEKMRVRIKISAAYGSDVDLVRQTLLACTENVPSVSQRPEPRIRFRSFGESGLDFELLCWVDEPMLRGRVVDDLNTRVYKAFQAAGIEIPYAKRDVYIKQMPAAPVDSG